MDSIYNSFLSVINNAFSGLIPFGYRKSSNDPPWVNRSLKRLKNARNKAHKNYRKLNCAYFRNKFLQLRREFQFLHRFLHNQYLYTIECNIKSNSKLFWVYINKLKNSAGIPTSLFLDDLSSCDLQSSVNLFASHFSSVFMNSESSTTFSDDLISPITDLGFLIIESRDIISAINALDNNHSPDADNICNLFVKKCMESLIDPLLIIFNLSLKSGVFLDCWKISSIFPIFKSGNKHDVKNYRGIAKIKVLPKLFESIVKNKIFNFVKEAISPYQHGFMPGRSTSSNLVSFSHCVLNGIENGFQVDSIYTDFSKAFDQVRISFLIDKLALLGFHSVLLKWIKSYLINRFYFVQIENTKSRLFHAGSGVPQGSHLGPLLFLLMVNDIPLHLNNCHILLYADDVKLFSIIKSLDDCHSLQENINSLSSWCAYNGFSLNFSKCSVMSFYRSRYPILFTYLLNYEELSRCNVVKDLGVMLDTKLSFSLHIDYICARAFSMLGFLKRNSKGFKDLGTLKILYFSLVRSLVEYCSIVWTPNYQSHSDRLERVQRSFSRFALFKSGFKNRPSYTTRCLLLGIDLLSNRRKIACSIFVLDLLMGKVNCPELLCDMGIFVPSRPLRSHEFLSIPFHRSNYGRNEPLTNCMANFNAVFDVLDFNLSREVLVDRVKMKYYFSINNSQ